MEAVEPSHLTLSWKARKKIWTKISYYQACLVEVTENECYWQGTQEKHLRANRGFPGHILCSLRLECCIISSSVVHSYSSRWSLYFILLLACNLQHDKIPHNICWVDDNKIRPYFPSEITCRPQGVTCYQCEAGTRYTLSHLCSNTHGSWTLAAINYTHASNAIHRPCSVDPKVRFCLSRTQQGFSKMQTIKTIGHAVLTVSL